MRLSTTEGGPSNPVDIRDYGAVGDGIKDDTVAIANAIAFASSSGINKVYIPAGIHAVTTGFNLPDNFIVFGSGESSILRLNKKTYLNDFATQGAMFMGRPSYGNGNSNDGSYGPNSSKTTLNITIRDLAIDLQKDPTNFSGGYAVPADQGGGFRPPMVLGIRFYNPVNCLIDNVKISNPWGGGIQFKTTIDGVESSNNTIQNCTIVMQEWYKTINGVIYYDIPLPNPSVPNAGSMIGIELNSYCNFSTNNGSACYDVNPPAGSGISRGTAPYNCDSVAKITRNYSDGTYISSRTYNNTVTNCIITNGSHCISLANARNNTITNNIITNGSNRGIILSSRSDSNVMSYNTMSLCGSTGLLMGYNASYNTASYNLIASVRGGESQGIGANVLATNNLIEYNTITGSQQAGIRVSHGPTGNVIRNNIINGTNSADTTQKGISLLANWLKYYCLDALRYGDQLTATNNVIQNNTISNVNIGVQMGDEKGFTPTRLSGNVVSNNTYANIVTSQSLNVMFYTRPDNTTSTDEYFAGTACPTQSAA